MFVSVITILYLVMSTCGHDFHVSRVHLNYNEDERIIEVSTNIFIDDLEKALSGSEKDKLNLGTSAENETADEAIAKYLARKFRLYNGVVQMSPTWLGKEVSDDRSTLWIYFYFEWDGTGSLIVHNSILTEIFEDQRNIIESTIHSKKEYLLLTKTRTKGILN